jgi:hypothetical protein
VVEHAGVVKKPATMKKIADMKSKLSRHHQKFHNIFLTAPDNIVYRYCDKIKQECTLHLRSASFVNKASSGEFLMLILSDFTPRCVDSVLWDVYEVTAAIYDHNRTKIKNTEAPVRLTVKFPKNTTSVFQRYASPLPTRVVDELVNTNKVLDPGQYNQLLAIAVTKFEPLYLQRCKTPAMDPEHNTSAHAFRGRQPFTSMIITESMDGDLTNDSYIKHLFPTTPKGKKNGVRWGLLNLTMELFHQSTIFDKKGMVHCNLHEGNMKFKAFKVGQGPGRGGETSGKGTTQLLRVRTHICGFEDLRDAIPKANGVDVDLFSTHCRYVPHYVKKGEKKECLRSPRTIAAFGIGVILYRLLLRLALQSEPVNTEKEKHKPSVKMLKYIIRNGLTPNDDSCIVSHNPSLEGELPLCDAFIQPDFENVVKMLTEITYVYDIIIMPNPDWQTNFIHFVALCVSGELRNSDFELVTEFSDPSNFLNTFAKKVFSKPFVVGEGAEPLETVRFKSASLFGIPKTLQGHILTYGIMSWQELTNARDRYGEDAIREAPLQIKIGEVLCGAADSRCRSCCLRLEKNPDLKSLNLKEVFSTLSNLQCLQSLQLLEGGCFTTLSSLGVLKNLKVLEVSSCDNLVDVPLLKFPNLEVLALKFCKSLESLQNITCCTKLKEVELIGLIKLATIECGVQHSHQMNENLVKITVAQCNRLEVICGLTDCINLKTMKLSFLPIFREIHFNNFRNLKNLQIYGLEIFKNLNGLQCCTLLKKLSLGSCPMVTSVSTQNLANLESIYFWDLPSLTKISELQHCVGLNQLELGYMPSLVKINDLPNLENIRRARFACLGNVKEPTIQDLRNFEKL